MWSVLTSKFKPKRYSMALIFLKWLRLWLNFSRYGINQNFIVNICKTNNFYIYFSRNSTDILAQISSWINHCILEHVRLDYMNKQFWQENLLISAFVLVNVFFGMELGLRPVPIIAVQKLRKFIKKIQNNA